MKILVAQLNLTVGDFKGNREKIIRAFEQARENGCDVVLTSELALCGYPPEDLLLHHAFIEETEESLKELLPYTRGLVAVVGMARRNPREGVKRLLNSAVVMEDGKIVGYYDKWLLPTYDVFSESRYFDEGRELGVWTLKGKRVGITICEDMWQHGGFVDEARYTRDPIKEMASQGVDVMLNLSASPYHSAKPETRVEVCAAAAKTLKCPVILCGQVGANDQLVFDGYSLCVDGSGELRAIAKGFREDSLVIDPDRLPPGTRLVYEPMHNLFDALVLGVRDYFFKHGFKKGCLGLSGGIDSAVTAVIAAHALGKENVLGITMPSKYSSKGSIKDSQTLAKHLGIEFLEIPIAEPFSTMIKVLEPYFQKKPQDVTEENVQARIRGMILMALSNKLGYVVLSTGNKSEMAVGYSTLYGDMCGGLGVLSDVSKTKVYALARWINREREVIPLATIEKPPSAELRPNQKDSDTLPDYAIVDAVLEGFVEHHLSVEEICEKCSLSKKLVQDLVRRIYEAEYKRRQAPPGIRVTRRAFGVGRRYPIVHKWK